jgi:hypothetical protein
METEKPKEKLNRKRLAYKAHLILQKAMIKPDVLAELTVEEMAKRLDVSTSHLSRAYLNGTPNRCKNRSASTSSSAFAPRPRVYNR